MNRIRQIDAELRDLESRREVLVAERERLAAEASEVNGFTPSQKIALFLSLFRCREDVYPKLWENAKDERKGYAPACANEWFRGVCEKPRVKCSECFHQAFPPLDEVAARDHLTGKHTIGTYAKKRRKLWRKPPPSRDNKEKGSVCPLGIEPPFTTPAISQSTAKGLQNPSP